MDSEELNKYLEAGKIAAQSLEYGKALIKKNAKVIDVLDKIEEKIHFLGGKPAFPAQISLNHLAAHFCPEADDQMVFGDDVICLDVGVHVDGYIGDNALTIDLSGKHEKLVNASREALNNALKIIKVGTSVGEIGRTIQETIQGYGFAPIKNLSGHGLAKFEQHTSPSIPNYDTKETIGLEKGIAFAVEPFASTGAGLVQDAGIATVFSFIQKKPVRSPFARETLKEIEKFDGLPFTTRWLTRTLGAKAKFGLRELEQAGVIHGYPPLADQRKGMVSQAEHTVVIDDDGNVHVTTRI